MQRLHATAEAAERAFYAAMADGDLDRMMGLWADDDAAVCNHPGGPRLLGRDAIRRSFREIFADGGVRIATASVQSWRSADVAVHSLIERIPVDGRDGTELVECVATNVFVRTTAGWRILVHHAGVADSADDEAAADDDDDTDTDRPAWAVARLGRDRRDDDDDDGAPDVESRVPPPGRLH